MIADRSAVGQHIAAVLTVVVLSVLLTGLVEVGEKSFGIGSGVETPVAGDLGGIRAPSHQEWGRTVMSLSGLR